MKKKSRAKVSKAPKVVEAPPAPPVPYTPIFKVDDKAYQSEMKKTADGFENFTAKLGVGVRGNGAPDNIISDGCYIFNLVTRNRIQLEAAYRGSWIVGQVVDNIAEDMTRSGIDIVTNKGAEGLVEFETQMSRLQIWQSVANAIKWGRLYGGSIAVVLIKGQKLETELDMDTVGKDQFQGLAVYDRWQLAPDLTKLIDSGPEMGLPKYYDIVLGSNLNDPGLEPGTAQHTSNSTGRVRVHHTRCIRMIGIQLPFFQAITEMMWGESVLERMWDRLIEFDTATASTGNLVTRANLRTIGIDGLREIIAAGGDALQSLVEQFEMMRERQVNDGITLIDKNDTFTSTSYSFAGLADVLIQFAQQISGSCGIPLVRLFGQSPAGLSATGEADIRLYYDGINAKQESSLRNPMEMIIKCLWRSITGQGVPDDLTFTFTPLWQMSATDKATVVKTNTDTICEAHQEGAIDTPTMMKELKQSSGTTGLFTHITDENISDAENEEPPMPEVTDPEVKGSEAGELGEGPEQITKPKAKDGMWGKVKAWMRDADFNESDHPRKKDAEAAAKKYGRDVTEIDEPITVRLSWSKK